jgi:hypothetical protein
MAIAAARTTTLTDIITATTGNMTPETTCGEVSLYISGDVAGGGDHDGQGGQPARDRSKRVSSFVCILFQADVRSAYGGVQGSPCSPVPRRWGCRQGGYSLWSTQTRGIFVTEKSSHGMLIMLLVLTNRSLSGDGWLRNYQ